MLSRYRRSRRSSGRDRENAVEREAAAEKVARKREGRIDAQLGELNAKMDAINVERETLVGVISAIRIIFAGFGVVIFYLIKDGVPEWFRAMMR